MSLRVWLPLNGDLRNLGCSGDIQVTNNGATVDNNGKIGKCYYFNGTNTRISLSSLTYNYPLSICAWIKGETITDSNTEYIFSYNTNTDGTDGHNIGFGTYGGKLSIWHGGTVSSYNTALSNNIWYHVTAVVTSTTYALYLNGIPILSGNRSEPNRNSKWFTLGARSNSTTGGVGESAYHFKGFINDARIYDHALSAAEVAEIAMGLVLHYKLDSGVTTAKNLIKNGYGELNSINWENASYISSEIPPNHPEIKKSFYSNITTEYIPIESTHSYKLEVYLKNTATSGYTYPSLYPYDIDKNFIWNHQCPNGFNLTTMTTLKQELKSGDTKIYVNDLSKWNANSGHYYNSAAIFSYSDSTGYIYPDGTYTQITPAFGSGTNAKTNLDKTNNIITLNSAYSGPTKPAGTAVCAAADGSTYYYPFSGLAKSSLNDWTYKTATIIPNNISRLKYAKYIRYSTYDGTLHAGIKLIDLADDIDSTIVSDSSGYEHNGEIISELHISNDTARYNNSTLFDGVDDCIIVPYNKVCPENIFTINLWFKKDALGSKNYETLFGGPGGFEMDTRSGSSSSLSLYMASTRNSVRNSVTPLTFGEWFMITMTRDGIKEKYYVNGIYQSEIDAKAMPTGIYRIGAWASNTGQNYYGLISDFRIYCTPLLDTDIKSLYNLGMKIDNLSTLHTYELEETNTDKLIKTGILKSQGLYENGYANILHYDKKIYVEQEDGSTWVHICHHNNPANGVFSSNGSWATGYYIDADRWYDVEQILPNLIEYEFMVKQRTTSGATETKYRWIQSINPMNATWTDVKPGTITYIETSGYTNGGMGGMYYRNGNSQRMCIANSSNGNWFGGIGVWGTYQGGIPGYPNTAVTSGYVDLYARVYVPTKLIKDKGFSSIQFIEA